MSTVEVREVGPRDGLQNEPPLPIDARVALIDGLVGAGLRVVEVGAFVRPDAVPAMAGTAEVLARVTRVPGVRYRALVPNLTGARHAVAAGAGELEVVLSASRTHNAQNLNMTPEQSLDQVAGVVALAGDHAVPVDAIVATAFGCPFEGDVEPDAVAALGARLRDLGVDTMTFADTTGMAAPPHVTALVDALAAHGIRAEDVAMHFHNSRNTGMANLVVALQQGVRRFDASIGGLGGCPFSPGATGNVPTEDVVHLLHLMGHDTGVDLDALLGVARLLESVIGRRLPGQVLRAGPRTRLAAPPERRRAERP